ncbi:leucine-rich repeat receptor-like protein kinase [Pyrus ussuriensis x Pyrus communis]|uniref:Leucine-rich repeat receptor-like protein kinase n=1 Tax=Pyrus ussuriensis x Pyrus communis TaxID=2448454 RepID=A0A5N5GU37_9ROSA|nr:leucine-rich repeat receptor-like protein kinase [Pyrus ussuriensis x Pyrus communis]
MDNPVKVFSLLRFLSIAITISICLCNGILISAPCKEYERQALLVFKQDLKGPSNRLLSWVGGERDCCNWTGVLHLGNYYSDEEFSSESLSRYKSLGGKLNLPLLNLKHLSYLDLHNNDFEGIEIPSFLVENLEWISGLSLLQHLNIAAIDLSKVSHWLQGKNTLPFQLMELHMSECFLHLLPGGISNMTSLRVLNLDYNSISSPIPNWLYTFSYLETLVLSENNFHGEISSYIGNLTALVNLDIFDNQLDGKVPNSLGNLCKLMVLDLSKKQFQRRRFRNI